MNLKEILNKQISIISKEFTNDKGQLLHKTNGDVANLWDYSAYFTALIKAYKVDNTNKEKLMKAIAGLEWYLSKTRSDNFLVYASDKGEEKPVFYDDNVWLAIGYLELYELFEDNKYLDKAIKLMEFILNSWQEHVGGGLLWREFPQGTAPNEIVRNTCINAPAAYASTKIYQFTNEKKYLDEAIKIYDWTKKVLKDPNSGLYFDHISENNIYQKTFWSYNVGVMISTGSLLYKITNNQEHYEDVINSIKSSVELLAIQHEDLNRNLYFDDHPWFRVYLFQGLLDAFNNIDNKIIGNIFDEVIKGFDYIYENYQNKASLILNKWTKLPKNDHEDKLLFASGNLESVCIFLDYLNAKKKVGESE